MALQLIQDKVQWVQQVKGKKQYEWRIWNAKDQYLELYFEPSDETNHAVLPEPFTGDHHSSHYYICANPPTHEERTQGISRVPLRGRRRLQKKPDWKGEPLLELRVFFFSAPP